jgi:glycosyltransferase involved in cell wall biosynthesis
VICAHSDVQWDDLKAVVASVAQQTHRPAEIVLVIDHNPILQRRSSYQLPGVKVVPNDNEQGLPGARNAGVAAAESEVVAFVDDAVVERNWLAVLTAPYADPHVLGVGGQIIPVWQPGRPKWFPPEFDWVVGCSYRGMPPGRTQVPSFSGAIMSLRRRLLVDSGGFDAGLGRIGTRTPGCEETEICARLRRRHLDGVYLYEPKAVVRRHVPRSRSTWSYYRSRCYAEGLSKAVVRGLAGPEWIMSSEKSYVWSTIPWAIGRNLGEALSGRPDGIARAMALAVGVLTTGIGYAVGRIRFPRNIESTQVRWPTMADLGAVG